jgi:hypothetical protein
LYVTNPIYSFGHGEVFNVRVGPNEVYLPVPGSIIEKSTFFKDRVDATTGHWKDKDSKNIALPHVGPEVFHGYLEHRFIGKPVIRSPEEFVTMQGEYTQGDYEDEQSTCVEAYILGQLLKDEEFCRHVGNVILDRFSCQDYKWKAFTPRLVTRIWERTSGVSHLRAIVLHHAPEDPLLDCKRLTSWITAIRMQEFPIEFVGDVMSEARCFTEMRAWIDNLPQDDGSHSGEGQ